MTSTLTTSEDALDTKRLEFARLTRLLARDPEAILSAGAQANGFTAGEVRDDPVWRQRSRITVRGESGTSYPIAFTIDGDGAVRVDVPPHPPGRNKRSYERAQRRVKAFLIATAIVTANPRLIASRVKDAQIDNAAESLGMKKPPSKETKRKVRNLLAAM